MPMSPLQSLMLQPFPQELVHDKVSPTGVENGARFVSPTPEKFSVTGDPAVVVVGGGGAGVVTVTSDRRRRRRGDRLPLRRDPDHACMADRIRLRGADPSLRDRYAGAAAEGDLARQYSRRRRASKQEIQPAASRAPPPPARRLTRSLASQREGGKPGLDLRVLGGLLTYRSGMKNSTWLHSEHIHISSRIQVSKSAAASTSHPQPGFDRREMSKARSPNAVCSTTIRICGLMQAPALRPGSTPSYHCSRLGGSLPVS